jgi:hypothetical protein
MQKQDALVTDPTNELPLELICIKAHPPVAGHLSCNQRRRDRMFAATLILVSYFAVPITLATAVLLQPKIEKRRIAARVIVSARRDI